jgi:hypothetical protein
MSLRLLAELAPLLAAVLLAWWLPRLPPSIWSLPARTLRQFARTPRQAILGSAVLSFLVCPIFSWVRPPSPHIHDEFSYLLAADTFAHGRLTNPTHPLWEHFETFHVIHTPSYQSKYPPGQALFLAAGQVLTGRPIVGVWLSVAAAAAAVCWMLLAFAPPRWALFGALLPAFRFGALPMWDDFLWFGYWNTSFWGGAVTMAGGALLLGALPRLLRKPVPRHAMVFAAGLLVLANTRPFEGLVVALGAAPPLAWSFLRNSWWRGQVLRAVLPGVGILLLGALAMGFYHQRVTGSALTMPYQVYRDQYEIVPLFSFQPAPPEKAYRHQQIRDYAEWMKRAYERRAALGGMILGLTGEDLFDQPYFFWGYTLWLPLLWLTLLWLPLRGLPGRGQKGISAGASHDGRWAVFFAGLIVWLVAASAITAQPRLQPHYLAPAAPAFVYLAVAGLRRMRTFSLRGRRLGRAVAEAVVAVSLLSFLFACALRAHRGVYYPTPLSQHRPQIIAGLEASPGKDLVIVSYAPTHNMYEEWVYNGADPDSQTIVWARDMGAAKNQELIDYYNDRHIWRLFADESPPKLEPYRVMATR